MLLAVGEHVLAWVFACSGGIVVVLLIATLRTWPRGARCRCVGDKRTLRKWFSMGWVLWRGRCWYNLEGLASQDDEVRCPECGTLSQWTRLKKDGRRIKLGSIFILFLVIAITSGYLGPIRNGTWARVVPTYPLVMMSDSSFGEYRTDIRDEISRRVLGGNVLGRSARLLSKTLVVDLRSDSVRWNRQSAYQMLQTLWPESRVALEHEAAVGDNQSKTSTMWILQQQMEIPSDILLSICVSCLQDESLDGNWTYIQQGNARSAVRYLSHWQSRARPYLIQGMQSNDYQQRFLSAIATGFGEGTEDKELVVQVLTPYLQDNSIMGDAKLAAPAIYHLGPDVIPLLEIELDVADAQARSIILHIIERLTHPDRSYDECFYVMPRLTGLTHDTLTATLESLTYYFWLNIKE